MKKILFIALLLILAFVGVAVIANKTSNSSQLRSNNKLQVVTSFYPMYFFAKQIAGEKADVMNITPASAEPHDYEPTTQDVAHIEKSNMLIINGGKLESWGQKLKDQLQGTHVLVVVAGDGLAKQELDENGQKIQDPHVWQDPILAKQEVMNIEKGFENIDPKDASFFKANAKKLTDALDVLDQEFRNGLTQCQLKDFVTSHAAFGYLASRYGVNQVPISGVSPDAEPSAQKITEIADLVKKEQIKIIFFESLVSPKLSETIAKETGAKTLVLDPIEGISDDDMKAGRTYLTVMRDNLKNLRTALQCK